MSTTLEAQRHFLADANRLTAYAAALRELVHDGDVVLDLGTGTGVLGLLACRAGARRVYAVEATGIIEAAREVCRANGFDDRVVFIRGLSSEIELPESADVIVTDQINEFCFGAGLLRYLSDARRRFMKPAGTIVPGAVDLLLAPVESAAAGQVVASWSDPREGLDLSAFGRLAANNVFSWRFERTELLAEPVAGARVDAAQDPELQVAAEASLPVERDGTLHGVAGFFAAHLSPSVIMSNAPNAVGAIDRGGAFFPVDPVVDVCRGDLVKVRVDVVPADELYTWSVEVSDRGTVGKASGGDNTGFTTFRGSTFLGRLISSEDLERSRPDYRPVLTPRGEAQLTVLELCGSGATVDEIATEVRKRHDRLFAGDEAAARFVAEIVERSCR